MTNPKSYVHFFVDDILVNILRISKLPPASAFGAGGEGEAGGGGDELTGAGSLAVVFRHLEKWSLSGRKRAYKSVFSGDCGLVPGAT